MTDTPIIFSGPMVLALLDGRKTMTRRLAWRETDINREPAPGATVISNGTKTLTATSWLKAKPGNRLWVRENWKPHSIYAGVKPREIPESKVFYQADGGYAPSNTPWVPCIHMPRWASRLTLLVEAVKVERLQEISDADAIAEGAREHPCTGPHRGPGATFWSMLTDRPAAGAAITPVGAFRHLWCDLHSDESWESNPEVVAISFKVVKQNIDATAAKAA